MARDREQIYEASDWFKEALQKNQVMAVFCMKDNLLYMYVVCVCRRKLDATADPRSNL